MSESKETLSCGLDITCSGYTDIKGELQQAIDIGYNFICTYIFNPRNRRHFSEDETRGPATRTDLVLCSTDWSRLVVPIISPWINVDSECAQLRRASELALQEELSFASHLITPIAAVVRLEGPDFDNLARVLFAHSQSPHRKSVWVVVPLTSGRKQLDDVFEDSEELNDGTENSDEPWNWWNKFRLMCDSSKKIIPILEVNTNIPSPQIIDRWMAEPIKAVFINTCVFITNKKGFPVLLPCHQALLKRFFQLEVQVVLTGRNRHCVKGLNSYRLYLNHLFETREPGDIITKFSKGYEDVLQIPLQPLMDNLDSGTYEVFEKDPIKYTVYQEAIFNALNRKFGAMGEHCGPVAVVMVLGAGRGPLVNCALRAAEASGKKIKVYAVEKNKNAIITLQHMQLETWGDKVSIVSCDMRQWAAPELADIIVSELLGSFGDNELSPECLDGAQRFLKPDGISIPCRYTSYLAPIQSAKLWNDARMSYKESGLSHEAQLETSYVVRMLNKLVIDEPKALFTFNHPNNQVGVHGCNDRHKKLQFKASENCVVHGFAGYFDCVLFGDKVSLSIVPDTHSASMVSWFPVFFPIHRPICVEAGQTIEVTFWRLSDTTKVWYEWLVTMPTITAIHNVNGRSSSIGL